MTDVRAYELATEIAGLEVVDPALARRREDAALKELLAQHGPRAWSKLYDKCQGCSQTDQPHHSKGLCKRCHRKTPESKAAKLTWARQKYQNDPQHREKVLRKQKLYHLDHSDDQAERVRKWVKDNPDRARVHQANRNAKRKVYKPGMVVEYDFVPGIAPIKGTVLDSEVGGVIVQFATFQKKVPFKELRRVA